MSNSSKRSQDLPKGTAPDLGGKDIALEERAKRLYRWAESEALTMYSWYLAEKRGKARASKICRVFSIVMLTLGASAPTLALLTDKWVKSEWGYVALAAGGGAVLLDRSFGFSVSWTRYMTAVAAIGRCVARAQSGWMAWQEGGNSDLASLMTDVIDPLFSNIYEIAEKETSEWVSVFGENLSELHAALSDPPKSAT
ncbi:SLATT domain-containing protein [Streptomyces mirabilis]|uniref:SLATT domain-containing protein n=1 Tax=Streptomyces mirabilis TaxID=68239 RepID=UPI0036DB1696